MSVRLTSARPVGGRVPVPLKMTSAIRSPRNMRALCSPSTQLMASDKLDLPHPLGPTTAATPSANSRRVRSAKDLNPSISTFFSLYNLDSSRSVPDVLSRPFHFLSKVILESQSGWWESEVNEAAGEIAMDPPRISS